MLGNGACESACNIQACNYDNGDCFCSASCSPSDYGTCKSDCVTPVCDFSGFGRPGGCTDQFLLTLNFYHAISTGDTSHPYVHSSCKSVAECELASLQSAYETEKCITSCNRGACLRSMGFCSVEQSPHCAMSFDVQFGHCFKCADGFVQYLGYCLESCPRGFETLTELPQVCRERVRDGKETDEIYVFEDPSSSSGDGSPEAPYPSLTVGLAAVWRKRTVVYVLGESASFYTDKQHKEFYPHANLKDLLADSKYEDLTVKSLTCQETNHPKCSHAPCTVTWDPNFTLIVKGKRLTIINIAFTSTCTLDQSCSPLSATNLLVAGPSSVLTLTVTPTQSVSFTHIRARAILTINFGAVQLNDVSFVNVASCSDAATCGVIVQSGKCPSLQYCGKLTYTGGTVSQVNNYSELGQEAGLFLLLQDMNSIDIARVAFTYSLVTTSAPTSGLIAVENFLSLRIAECRFEDNGSVRNLINVLSKAKIPRTADSANVATLLLPAHITLQNVTFRQNFSYLTLVLLSMQSDLLNIAISGCVFAENSSLGEFILGFEYTEWIPPERRFGGSVPVTNANTGITKPVYIPKAWLTVADTVFTGHASFIVIVRLFNCANVSLKNVRFLGNVNRGGSGVQAAIKRFVGLPQVGASTVAQVSSDYDCVYLAFFDQPQNFEIQGFVHSDNECSLGSTTVSLNSAGGSAVVTSFFASNNTSAERGAVLSVQGSTQLTVSDFSAVDNAAGRDGVVYIQGNKDTQFTLKGSSFTGNRGTSGTAINAGACGLLRVESTLFKDNAAGEFGGAIKLFVSINSPVIIEVRGAEFSGNKALKGAAIYVSSSTSAGRVVVTVSACKFSANSAEDSGASVLIEERTTLDPQSAVSSSEFKGERSPTGAVTLYHASGKFTISQSSFSHNSGEVASCVLVQTKKAAETALQDVVFDSNEFGPAVAKPNFRIYSQLTTQRCTFTKNSFTSVVMENGLWTDTESVLESSMDTAVSLVSGATAVLTRTSFRRNSTPSYAGAIYINFHSLLKCTGCVFEGNYAATYGGAVFIEQEAVASLAGCRFQRNRAGKAGSALHVQSASESTTSIVDSQFFDNEAVEKATINIQSAILSMTTVVFDRNMAESSAGVSSVLATLAIADSVFRNQEASDSPFLTLLTSSKALIQRSTFENGRGPVGCIVIYASTLTAEGSTFRNITAHLTAIGISGESELHLKNCSVSGIGSGAAGSVITAMNTISLTIENTVCSEYQTEAVLMADVQSLVITGSRFVAGAGVYGSAVCCFDCVDAEIRDSVFAEQNSYIGAVYFHWTSLTYSGGKLTVVGSRWENNVAEGSAAGLYVQSYVLEVKGCTFANNSALSEESVGGALRTGCEFLSLCNYTIQDTVFVNNYGLKAGGAIYWKDIQPLLLNVSFADNSAIYGPDIASFPASLSLSVSSFSGSARTLESEVSAAPGQRVTGKVTASLIDHYGQLVNIDNSSIGEIVSVTSGAMTSDVIIATAVNGQFVFDNFLIYANQSSFVNISVTTEVLKYASEPVLFFMRDCIPGESKAPKSCLICAERTYSFDPNLPCQQCLSHTQCLGNFTVLPDSEYWRPGVYSELVYECPLPSACKGGGPKDDGSISYEGFCAEGYKGNKCQSCDIGYSRIAENKCGKCPTRDVNIVRIVLVAIAIFIVNAVLLLSSLKSALQPKALHSIYFKIMANYWQLVFLVTEFKLKWPDPILELFSAQQDVGGAAEQVYSIDCLLADNGDPSDVYYTKMIYIAVLPIFVISVAVLYWVAAAAIKRKRVYLRRELMATIVIAFFIIHPTLMKTLFSLFSCEEVKSGEYWLTTDMAIRCGDKEHMFYALVVGLPALLVWVVGVPMVCLGVLLKYRRRHAEAWIRLKFGFLLSGYRPSRFYWEFLILARKLAIISCFVFITNSTQVQALTLQIVLIFVFFLQYEVRPYTTKELNRLELLAISAADLTIYSGLYYLSEDLTSNGKWFFFAVIVVVNAVFIGYWSLATLKELVEVAAKAMPSIGSRLCPSLFERDAYIEDFVASAQRSRDYSKFALEDLKGVYHSVREKQPSGILSPSAAALSENPREGRETQLFHDSDSEISKDKNQDFKQ